VNPAFLFHFAVNTSVGAALLFAWHRDRRQSFSRALGLAYLVQALAPLAFTARLSAQPLLHTFGTAALALIAALALALLAIGVGHLANRPLRRAQLRIGVPLLLLASLGLAAFDLQMVQDAGAALNVALGLAACVWLWPLGRAERFAGVLLVLVGLNQFEFVWAGTGLLGQRALAAAVLRLLLGLTLLHAAVRRSAAESQVARDRFMRLTEHSHQGVGVVRGEQLLYANPALLRMYGLRSLDEVRTLWREATMPEAERAVARERHRQLISGELPQANWAGLRYRFDGTPIQLRFSAWRIDWDGEPAEQLVVTDETAQYDATAALNFPSSPGPLLWRGAGDSRLRRARRAARLGPGRRAARGASPGREGPARDPVQLGVVHRPPVAGLGSRARLPQGPLPRGLHGGVLRGDDGAQRPRAHAPASSGDRWLDHR